MAKENPWFKFEPAEWMFGRIQRQTPEVKAVFIDLICMYWHKQCNMSVEDAELDFGSENILTLLSNKIIFEDEKDNIIINFLDSQMDGIKETSNKASKAGLASAAKRKAIAEQKATTVEQPLNDRTTDKIREDKIIQDNKKEDNTEGDKPPVFMFKKSLLDYGLEKQLVDDFIKNRKTKKLSNTETALNSFIEEIEKTRRDKNELFKIIVEKGWGGFKASWNIDENNNNNGAKSPHHNIVKDGDYGVL